MPPDGGASRTTWKSKRAASTFRRTSTVDSETVLLFSEPERRFTSFHHSLDGIADVRHVNRAFARDLAERLVAGFAVVAPRYQFGITVHDKIGVVACEDDLAMRFGLPELFDDFGHDRVIEVFLGLVDYQGWP